MAASVVAAHEREMDAGVVGGHWFFLPGMNCWQMGSWALPKQDMAQVSLCVRQVARLLRSLHDTFAEVRQGQPYRCKASCPLPCQYTVWGQIRDLACSASFLCTGILYHFIWCNGIPWHVMSHTCK